MKTKKLKLIVVGSALFLLGSCGNNKQDYKDMKTEKEHDHSLMEDNYNKKEEMHQQHESIKDILAHQDIIILDVPYQIEIAEKESFQNVVTAYIELKNAFVEEDLDKIDRKITTLKEKVNKVNGQLLKNEGEKTWKQHAELYNVKLDEMAHIKGLENKRSYFSHISEIVYCTIKSFDFENKQKLYVTFCPMAFEDKGAYWISETKEIKNPYFGSKMMNCGSIKEEL